MVIKAIVTYFTAGAGTTIVNATLSSAVHSAMQSAIEAAITSMVNQAVTQVATAAITGNSLSLDMGSIAKGAVMAGVLSYANGFAYSEAGIDPTQELSSSQLAEKTLIDTTTQTAVYGGKFIDNLKMNTANSVQTKASNVIGKDYAEGNLNYVTHKLAHAATGAISAEIAGKDAASGALGAVTGEVIGEAVGNNLIQDGEFSKSDEDLVRLTSQLGTIGVAGLTHKDLDTALNSSEIAVDNNMIQYLMGAALGAGSDLYSQYKRNGNSLSWEQLDGKELIINTATGAWSGGAKTIFGAIVKGGVASGVNESYNQKNNPNGFNSGEVVKSTAIGSITGLGVAGMGKIGDNIIKKTGVVGKPVDEPLNTYKNKAESLGSISGATLPEMLKDKNDKDSTK